MAQRNMARGCLRNRRKPSRTHCQPEDAGRYAACMVCLLDDLESERALCPIMGGTIATATGRPGRWRALQHSSKWRGSRFSVWAGLGRK